MAAALTDFQPGNLRVQETPSGFILRSPTQIFRFQTSEQLTSPLTQIKRPRTSSAQSPPQELIAKDRRDYKKDQAITLARATRRLTHAEEIEAIIRAEEDAILTDIHFPPNSNECNEKPPNPSQLALLLARATRDTIMAAHQTAVCEMEVLEQQLRQVHDRVEELGIWLRDAEEQVGGVLDVLASAQYEGLTPDDFRPPEFPTVPPVDESRDFPQDDSSSDGYTDATDEVSEYASRRNGYIELDP